jgi:NAD(P)-dependent dehydrogenase (short-subunit alcohol dehydrogenase family)/acyl carrier protein
VEGRIGPLPVAVFPAAQVVDAFRLMSRARHIGKVVIDFRGDRVPAVRLAPQRLRGDRTYLVSGAFGGFGQALTRWMAREGAGRLVLISRSGGDNAAGKRLVSELVADGVRVDARALDVGDSEAVRGLVEEIRRDGPPLGGVFHAAMVLDDGLLATFDARRLEAVMRPKAIGAWNLHHSTCDDPIEHFVLFSSVSHVLGNLGQGAYCAANSFLDGLARRRRADGRAAVSIAWGVLSDTGVAVRSGGLVEQLERLGVGAFTTTQALLALGFLMDTAPANIAFANVDWASWARHASVATTPRFSRVVQSSADDDRLTAFRRELVAHPADERLGVLKAMVRSTLGPVLGTPPDRIPADVSLEKLGVDSLMAVELSAGLEQQVGVRLSTSVLMQGPTVSMLASHMLTEVLAVDRLDASAVESLSEAETDAMLELLAAAGELDLSQLS